MTRTTQDDQARRDARHHAAQKATQAAREAARLIRHQHDAQSAEAVAL